MLTISKDTIGATVINSSPARSRLATIALIVGFAVLTGVAAQWRLPLGFTPVPITGQTFAVLLSGAVLGMRAGATSQLTYLAMGVVGFPFFAGGESGWEVLVGPTAGYLVGFVLAAAAIGRMAELKADRRIVTAIPSFILGSFIIYACGALGLVVIANMALEQAIRLGVAPFLVGDLFKAVAAGLALPTAWAWAQRMQG